MSEGMVKLTAEDNLVKDGVVFDILSQDGNTGTVSILAGRRVEPWEPDPEG